MNIALKKKNLYHLTTDVQTAHGDKVRTNRPQCHCEQVFRVLPTILMIRSSSQVISDTI